MKIVQMDLKARWWEQKKMWRCRPTIDGKPRSFCSKASAQEAEQKAREYLEQRGKLEIPKVPAQTVGMFIAREVAGCYRGSKANMEQARWGLGILIDHIGAIPVNDLKLSDCQAFLDEMAATRAFWTVRHLRKYLGKTCRLLARYERIPFNYMEELRSAEKPARRQVLSAPEAMRLWLRNKNEVCGSLIFCCFVIGMDSGEALKITREHFKAGTLHIPGTKNTYRDRNIPLTPGIERILKAYLGNEMYLVRGEDGQPLRHNFSRMMTAAAKRAELPRVNLKSLRHAFGAIEYKAGCPRSVRKGILGQSNRSDMGDLYVHPTQDAMRSALKNWEKFLHLSLPGCLPGEWIPEWIRPLAKNGYQKGQTG